MQVRHLLSPICLFCIKSSSLTPNVLWLQETNFRSQPLHVLFFHFNISGKSILILVYVYLMCIYMYKRLWVLTIQPFREKFYRSETYSVFVCLEACGSSIRFKNQSSAARTLHVVYGVLSLLCLPETGKERPDRWMLEYEYPVRRARDSASGLLSPENASRENTAPGWCCAGIWKKKACEAEW